MKLFLIHRLPLIWISLMVETCSFQHGFCFHPSSSEFQVMLLDCCNTAFWLQFTLPPLERATLGLLPSTTESFSMRIFYHKPLGMCNESHTSSCNLLSFLLGQPEDPVYLNIHDFQLPQSVSNAVEPSPAFYYTFHWLLSGVQQRCLAYSTSLPVLVDQLPCMCVSLLAQPAIIPHPSLTSFSNSEWLIPPTYYCQ